MSPADLVRFAVQALRGHRVRTGMSLVGVTIGVAAVVVLTALGDGARRFVLAQFASLGTNVAILFPGRTETTGVVPGLSGAPHDLTLEDVRALARALPEAQIVAPMALGSESVAYGGRRRQVLLIGVTDDMRAVRHLRVARGTYIPPLEPGRGDTVAVLGEKLAHELFPATDPVGRIVRIGDWRMRVIGVTAHRGVQMGMDLDDAVHVPVATAMRLLNRASLYQVLVQARTRRDLGSLCTKAVALITERHREEDVTCVTQDALVSTFGEIVGALTLALAAIAAISLSVAGIGIMNVMLVSVSERTREVGLLRALGAGRRQVMALFLAEAMLLSTAGGCAGLAVGGAAVAVLVGLYPQLPARPPLWAVAGAFALSVAVGTVFGILPARRAARLEPARALSGR